MKRGRFAPQSISCSISPPALQPLGPTSRPSSISPCSNIRTCSPTLFFPSYPSYRHTPPYHAYNPCNTINIAPITFPVNNALSLVILHYFLIILSRNTPKSPQKCPKSAVATLQKFHVFIIFTSFLLISAQFLTISYKFPAIFTKSLHFTTFCSIIRYKERGGSSA